MMLFWVMIVMGVLDASKRGLMNVLIELAKAKKEAVKLILSKISCGM
jgi:hydrogenase maturation factor